MVGGWWARRVGAIRGGLTGGPTGEDEQPEGDVVGESALHRQEQEAVSGTVHDYALS